MKLRHLTFILFAVAVAACAPGSGQDQALECDQFEIYPDNTALIQPDSGQYRVSIEARLDPNAERPKDGRIFSVREKKGQWWEEVENYRETPPGSEFDILFLPDIAYRELPDPQRGPDYLDAVFDAVLQRFNFEGGDRGTVATQGFDSSNPDLTSSRVDLLNRLNRANTERLNQIALARWWNDKELGRRRIAMIIRWHPEPPPTGYLPQWIQEKEVFVINIGMQEPQAQELQPNHNYFMIDAPHPLPDRYRRADTLCLVHLDLDRADLGGMNPCASSSNMNGRLERFRTVFKLTFSTKQLFGGTAFDPSGAPQEHVSTSKLLKVAFEGMTCPTTVRLRFQAARDPSGKQLVRLVSFLKAIAGACLVFSLAVFLDRIIPWLQPTIIGVESDKVVPGKVSQTRTGLEAKLPN